MGIKKYKYTQDWFSGSNIRKCLPYFVFLNRRYRILEIGSFEGLSSCFFSDFLLDHSDSFLHCVDPFVETGSEISDRLGITTQCVTGNTKKTFLSNIAKSKNPQKVTLFCETSTSFFEQNFSYYDLVYVDGCHEPEYIYTDVLESFKRLALGGILWMDDYLGNTSNCGKCSIYYDKALSELSGKFKVIWGSYQLAVQRIA